MFQVRGTLHQSFKTGIAYHQEEVRDKDKINQLENRQDHVGTVHLWKLGDQMRSSLKNCTRMTSNLANRPKQNGAIAQRVNRTQFRAILFRRSSGIRRMKPLTKLGLVTLFNHVMGASEP